MKTKVVTIGGGTGQYMILSELKKYANLEVSAVVAMGDSGGSTGLLRDELGVLPPGDVRQALVALSPSENILRDLFNYRFDAPSLSGHSFGNLFLSALEKISGSFTHAVAEASKILRISGEVVPSAITPYHLVAENEEGGFIYQEGEIDKVNTEQIKRLYLDRKTPANPRVLEVINEADIVVFCPGTFFCSVLPHVLLDGFREALCRSNAEVVFCANLMTSNHFTVEEYVGLLEHYAKASIVDTVIYNSNTSVPEHIVEEYMAEGESLVVCEDVHTLKNKNVVAEDLLDTNFSGDLVRHDASKLVQIIIGKNR